MKIIGVTVGTTTPKPNFDQTDPRKGDYIKGDRSFLRIDDTLSQAGISADAKAVGDAINLVQQNMDEQLDNKADANHGHSDYVNQTTFNQLNDLVEDMSDKIADLLYKAITISSFTHNAGTKERGATVTNVTLSWETNKTPSTLILDGASLDVNTTSKAISGLSITWDNNKTWKLDVADERGATATKSVSITFCNNIYYGVGAVEGGFNSAFVTSLSKKLQTSKAYDFTVNPTAQYIYYAVPTRLGTVSFKVGGFEGGFEAPETVSVTNSSNYTETYYVYRSTNKITGSTTVDVT